MIRLFAADARVVLNALDEAEAFRRRRAHDCPCGPDDVEEYEGGALCDQCNEDLLLAGDYADLAGMIFEALENYVAEPSDALPATDRPPQFDRNWTTGPTFGKRVETVILSGELL